MARIVTDRRPDLRNAGANVAGHRFSDVRRKDAGTINAVVEAGIMRGCGGGEFCPERPVRRAQLATFLHRALY